MKSVMVALVLGAGAVVASAASAAPLPAGPVMLPDSGIENVRLVCDDFWPLLPHPRRPASGRSGIRRQLQLRSAGALHRTSRVLRRRILQ